MPFKLLDEYFDIVWEQVTKALTYPDHEMSFFTDIRNVWGTEQQFEFLYEKSQKRELSLQYTALNISLDTYLNTLSEAEKDNANTTTNLVSSSRRLYDKFSDSQIYSSDAKSTY